MEFCKDLGPGAGEGVEDATQDWSGLRGRRTCENGSIGDSLCRGINGCVGGDVQDCGLRLC